VLHSYLPSQRWYPASLTKLMTVYLAFEALRDGRIRPETPVRISELAAAQAGNKMGWPVGRETTLDEAIRILLVKSANDVAVAVAEAVSGDLEGFVADMNAAAARLGMTDTRFANPHGLHDDEHYSTARDLALLSAALARDFPEHQDVFALETLQVGGESLQNFNRLLGSFPGADGMKTGYICESGYNIVASALRDDRRVIAVVLGATSEDERARVAAELLDRGFADPSGGDTLDSLGGPQVASEPIDLRPYVCGGTRLPPELASFGIGE
jgi:D-alanyl-D-alanine carboxypeptidase